MNYRIFTDENGDEWQVFLESWYHGKWIVHLRGSEDWTAAQSSIFDTIDEAQIYMRGVVLDDQ